MLIQIVLSLLQVYTFILLGRAILSWFRVGPDSPIAPLQSFLFQVTEPVLAPVRNALPSTGMFDISFIVVFIGVRLLSGLVANLA